jgi:hypothetical protein
MLHYPSPQNMRTFFKGSNFYGVLMEEVKGEGLSAG